MTDFGTLRPKRNRFRRRIIAWPYASMHKGDFFTVHPADRDWYSVRNSMYNAATNLKRPGDFKISPLADLAKSRDALIKVRCIREQSPQLSRREEEERIMRFQERRRQEQEAHFAEIRAMLD